MRPIDADALKVRLSGCMILMPNGEKCTAKRAIDTQGTIEAEPVRQGRWKKKNGEIYCTNCKKSRWSESFELMLRGFDFCPKCGADMREEGVDND